MYFYKSSEKADSKTEKWIVTPEILGKMGKSDLDQTPGIKTFGLGRRTSFWDFSLSLYMLVFLRDYPEKEWNPEKTQIASER